MLILLSYEVYFCHDNKSTLDHNILLTTRTLSDLHPTRPQVRGGSLWIRVFTVEDHSKIGSSSAT
jgi:hypothetical protein